MFEEHFDTGSEKRYPSQMIKKSNTTITITEIARIAGVTTATVSRALSGKKGVSERIREKICEVAKRKNYQPNLMAQKLVQKRSRLIGFIGSDLTNTDYVHAFRRLDAGCRERGYTVLLADSERNFEKENANIRYMLQNRVEGIIIYPVSDWMGIQNVPQGHYDELKQAGCPVVALGDLEEEGFDAIYSEEYTSSQKLARYLKGLGHVRYCLIEFNSAENRPARLRLQAFQEEIMFSPGPKKPAPAVTLIDAGHPGWEDAVLRLFNTKTPPTCILAVDPEVALKLYRPLFAKGIVIPRDVSLAAIGRSAWADRFIPTLTLSESDEETITTLAMDVLFRKIAGTASGAIRMEIHQKLMIRDSVAAPKD